MPDARWMGCIAFVNIKCWHNVSPPSSTLSKHCVNIWWAPNLRWMGCIARRLSGWSINTLHPLIWSLHPSMPPCLHASLDISLTFITLKYFCINHGDQRVFSIWNHHSASFEYLCYGATTVINIYFYSAGIDCLTSNSDVYKRQILTSIVDRRTERVNPDTYSPN